MFNFFKNRHKHTWRAINVSYYHSIVGPRTIVGYKCTTCPRIEVNNIRGEWTLEQLNND